MNTQKVVLWTLGSFAVITVALVIKSNIDKKKELKKVI